MKPNPIPPLHVVTDDAVVARGDFLQQAARIIQAAGPSLVFHLRAPRASGRRMFELACALQNALWEADGWLVVNDRVDVARSIPADGAQVGARGLAVADARRLLWTSDLLGASVHSADEARAAKEEGADFVLAGTIWESASHPGRPGVGTGLIREVAALGLPTIAIGGVTPQRVPEAREAGAAGVAVIRGVWDASDPAAAVDEYLRHWKG